MLRRTILTALTASIRAIPRIKGLGILIEALSRAFQSTDIDVPARIRSDLYILNPTRPMDRRRLFAARYHDREEFRFLETVLRPGDYVVDVGANIGLYSLFASRLVGPSGQVTAIEAEPNNADRFERHVALNHRDNIRLRRCGVSDKHETLSLHLDPNNDGMHSFVVDARAGDVGVECYPLAELVENRQPRLLKIDIEGFEYPVLRRYFADRPMLPHFILIEDWPEFHAEIGDPVALCLDHGYAIHREFGANKLLQRVAGPNPA